MKRLTVLSHEFIENIPVDLQEGTLYVSIPFATVVHKCCCGCGSEVVTPLSPTDWKLTFDGESISLHPSIGNWSFACQSHYWIRSNKVTWAPRWSQEKIDAGRVRDAQAKEEYFDSAKSTAGQGPKEVADGRGKSKRKKGLWQKLKRWLS